MRKLLAVLVLFGIVQAAGGQETTHDHAPSVQPTRRPAATASGANWKVSVFAAEKYTTGRPQIEPEVSPPAKANLRVELDFEYLGPDGKVAPPVLVAQVADRKLKTLGNVVIHSAPGVKDDYTIVAWLLSARSRQPLLRPVRTGQKFGTYSLYAADVPLESSTVTLKFGDAPAVTVELSGRQTTK